MRGERRKGSGPRQARRIVVAALVLALAGPLAPAARAGSPEGERRVRPLARVEPRATSAPTGLTPAQVKAAYGFPTSSRAG